MTRHRVFVTGATGYMGRHLIPELLRAGHEVRALARPGSEGKLPPGCELVSGNALDAKSYAEKVSPCDTLVHLIGVSHPSPAKARQFREIDLKSAVEAVAAAKAAGVQHLVYVSVAQPAPVMKAYLAARAEAEALIRSSGLNATFLRPWYVLGPGHRWPVVLIPFYWLFERIPVTRESALRLGLVSTKQMIAALRGAVENPAHGVRVVGVPDIRRAT
ncbi:MAG: NAD(P)H-binding protein [Acidobacteriia bacterium]|nr:NAD(P)H-binding protein [Terriglobia bacterium]